MKSLTFAVAAVSLSSMAASLPEDGLQAYWNGDSKQGMTTVNTTESADLDKDGKYEQYPVTLVSEWMSTGESAVALGNATNTLGRAGSRPFVSAGRLEWKERKPGGGCRRL